MKRFVLTVVSILALFVFFEFTSQAEQDEGVIQGCYKKKNGQLRIVNAPSDCKPSEVPVAWNIAGETGLNGEQGPQGPEGPQGPPGDGVSVSAYSDNSEYLGPLVGISAFYWPPACPDFQSCWTTPWTEPYVTIFIPSIRKNLSISTRSGESRFQLHRAGFPAICYTSSDCSGTPYHITSYTGTDLTQHEQGRYFIHSYEIGDGQKMFTIEDFFQNDMQFNSYLDISAECQTYTYNSENYQVWELSEVALTFGYPVEMPLSFNPPSTP